MHSKIAAASVIVLTLVAASVHAKDDASPRAEQRAGETLKRMTDGEKLSLLSGKMLILIAPSKRPADATVGAGYVAGVPRVGVPALVETDASLGVSNLLGMRKGDVATALPSGLALAATWNPAVLLEGGRMIGSEARAKGFNVMLAGGVNLVRDPRGGRNFEYLGEDPLLAGRLVAAQINGIQSNQMIATIKHYAVNNIETGRSGATVNMDEAAMRESDLLAFEIGIEGGKPGSVMCAYNRVNTIFACENKFLLTDVLRRDWGWKGFVMSDWGAVHSTEALTAGLDQQSGEQLDQKRYLSTELAKAVDAGRIPKSAIDTAARRILYSIYAHGLADAPAASGGAIDYAVNGAVARKAEDEGIVLLRNQGNVLPLAASVHTIVVIGGHADIGVLSGGGSSQVTPVGGFRKYEPAGSGAAASFARKGYGATPPLDALRAAFPDASITYLDGADRAAAATAATKADVAIVFADKFATEAEDQADLALGGGQDALIDAVATANSHTVVVLETGNPVLMPWRDKTAAILEAWYPGQRGGESIAAILKGTVNPSGRLPVTFPADESQLPNPIRPGTNLAPPSAQDRVTYGLNTNSPPFAITFPEGSDVGYRWFDKRASQPLYSFGFGLSYTKFSYDRIKVIGGRTVTATFRVTNIGQKAGADVPQVYVARTGKAKRLIGFEKIWLAPGESRMVMVTADRRLLADFNVRRHAWQVPEGKVQVEVARSATDPALVASTRITMSEIKP